MHSAIMCYHLMYVGIYVCMYVCMFVCMYACMYGLLILLFNLRDDTMLSMQAELIIYFLGFHMIISL